MDKSKIKKICGCAGSRKTDTLIKCGIHYLSGKKKKHNCLFLTLVGSVTDEITERISKMLDVKIEKSGMSNHFVGVWNNHTIEVANYDAFIHKQLENSIENCDCDDYEKKSLMLLQNIRDDMAPRFYLKNNDVVDMILIDEFQDVSTSRAEIIIEFFKKNKSTRLVVMGDILQTIFPQAIKDMKHPLMMIDELKPTLFRLNVCYRCPKSHLDVVNCITRTFRTQYAIPEMQHKFCLDNNRPLFFTHESISSHLGAHDTAAVVFKMIKNLMHTDAGIRYKDIVIIMKKSNHQLVFHYLQNIFKKSDLDDFCLVSNTKTLTNEHRAIDWNRGKERLMMLSIHGDKGKGHPVVFFLGFSGNLIPEERQFYKNEELLSQSLLNVALTRSTKYLFIGMTRTNPSFYFYQSYHELKNLAYFSWDQDSIVDKNIRFICKESLKSNHNPIIHRVNIRRDKLMTPVKNFIFIQNDEFSKQFIKKSPIQKIKINDGLKQEMNDEILIIIQAISKLIFLKKIKPKLIQSIFGPFIDYLLQNRCFFTVDDNLLNLVKDFYLNRHVQNEYYWMSTLFRESYRDFDQPMLIIHESFKDSLLTILADFTNNIRYNPSHLWNIAIFYLNNIENCQVNNLIFYMNQDYHDIDFLFKNIDAYLDYYRQNYKNPFKKFRFHQKSNITDMLTDSKDLENIGFQSDLEIDKKYFMNGYKFGISSMIDFIDIKNRVMIDFKIYPKNEFKEEWHHHNILHALLSKIDNFTEIHCIHVFNVYTGFLYKFNVSNKILLSNIIEPWLKSYEFSDFLIDRLKQKIIE